MSIGRSVRLHLVEGSVTGVLTAEIMNWTGHVIAGPRSRLAAALRREELSRTGIYLLCGPNPVEPDQMMVYVGEGDEVGKRLYAHDKDETKDFWDRFICISSKDLNLTKAHVRYLEARVLEALVGAKKSVIANKDFPTFDKLPEADTADMQSFLKEMDLILPVVGFDKLRRPVISSVTRTGTSASPKILDSTSDDIFHLKNIRAGIDASAREADGEFVILKGSRGSLKERMSFTNSVKAKRDLALSSGAIAAEDEDNFRVLEDIAFASPTGAAVFLFGTSRNGRTDWTHAESNTDYGTWKKDQLELSLAQAL